MAMHVVSSMMTPVGIEISRSQPTSANSSPTNTGSSDRSMKFWEKTKVGGRSEKRSNSDVYADQTNISGALNGKSESLRPSRSSSDLNNSITLPDVEVKRKHSADEINGITIFNLRKFKREKKRAKSTTQAPDLDCPLLLINGKRPSDNSRGSEYNDPSQSSAETGTDPLPTLSNQTSSSSPNVPVLDGSKSTSGFSFGRRKKKKSSTLRASEQNGGLGTSHRSEGGVACNGSVPGSEVSEDFSEEDGDDDGEVPSDDMGLCSPSNRKRRERVNRNTQRLFEEWQAAQEGREMTNQVYAMDVDMLFTYLFTNSKFYADFHKSRKTSDLVQSEWEQRSGLNDKFREVSMTLSLNNAMGPKHSGVVDSQVMKNDYTVAGEIYVIHVETVNSGIPYADSFYVTSHFCLTRVSKGTSRLVVWSNIKYKKSVWGFVKSIIEKNTWQGLEEFYNELSRDLQIGAAELAAECDVPNSLGGPLGHNPVNLKPNHSTTGLPETGEPILSQGMPLPYSSIRTLQPNEALRSPKATIPELQNVSKAAVILLILLLCANCLLYYKVWFLETTLVIDPKHPGSNSQRQGPFGPSSSFPKHLDPMLFLDKDPDSRTTEQWLEILQQQEMVHQLELEKWGEMLGTATELLRKTEDSLSNIQKSIQPLTLQKVRQMLLLQRDHERPPKPAFEPPIEPKPPVQQAVVDESPQVKKPSEVQQPQPHVKSDL